MNVWEKHTVLSCSCCSQEQSATCTGLEGSCTAPALHTCTQPRSWVKPHPSK